MGNKRVPFDRCAHFKVSTLLARDASLHAISRSRLAVHRMDSVRNCSLKSLHFSPLTLWRNWSLQSNDRLRLHVRHFVRDYYPNACCLWSCKKTRMLVISHLTFNKPILINQRLDIWLNVECCGLCVHVKCYGLCADDRVNQARVARSMVSAKQR